MFLFCVSFLTDGQTNRWIGKEVDGRCGDVDVGVCVCVCCGVGVAEVRAGKSIGHEQS